MIYAQMVLQSVYTSDWMEFGGEEEVEMAGRLDITVILFVLLITKLS